MNDENKTDNLNEEDKTKKIVAVCIIVVILAAVIAVAAVNKNKTEETSAEVAEETTGEDAAAEDEGEDISGEEDVAEAPTDEEAAAEEPAEAEEAVEVTKYYGGTYYSIGSGDGEMPAGEYVLQPDHAEGYFELAKDLDEESDSIIANGSYNIRTYVTVSDGQYLIFDGVAIPADEAEAYIPKTGYYESQAMYKVGFDIQPGEYAVSISSDGSDEEPAGIITVLKSSDGEESSVISEIQVEEDTEIALEDNTYIKIEGVTLSEPAN